MSNKNKQKLKELKDELDTNSIPPNHPHHHHHHHHHAENAPESSDPATTTEVIPEAGLPAATNSQILAPQISNAAFVVPEVVVVVTQSSKESVQQSVIVNDGNLFPTEDMEEEKEDTPLIVQEVKKKRNLRPGQIYYDGDRPKWEERYNCLLSMVGFAVGLSNIWRFPYLCFLHGGGAFLLPYFVFLFTCAIPVMYLEVIVGQFTQSGMISVWKLVPIFRGVGIVQTVLPFLIAFYYHIILAWALLYCVEAFLRSKVPWVGCHHPWNSVDCRDIPPDFEQITTKPNERRAGAEFFRGRVQRKWKSQYSPEDNITLRSQTAKGKMYGLADNDLGVGHPSIDVSLYLLAIYIAILLLLSRGLRIRGKSLWISVIAPYIMMLLLVFRGSALPGAREGLKFLFDPIRSHLWKFETWRAAAEQTFFSCGSGIGIHLTFASHNRFNHNMLADAVATALINALTSLICAIIVFIALGNIAFSDDISIDKLIATGPDLVFEVCADALGRLPGANFYSFIFYLMILLMGFESSLGALVCAKQSFFDVAGQWFDRNGDTRGVFIKFMMIIAFGVGLSCATRGGLHMFIFLDTFTAVEPLLLCSFLLVIGIVWIWGLHELCDSAEAMIGKRPSLYFQISWKFICPLVIFGMLVWSIVQITEAKYLDSSNLVLTEPVPIPFRRSIQNIGLVYSHMPDIGILIGILWYWFTSRGRTFKEKFLLGISPTYEHEDILATGTAKRAYLKHYTDNWPDCFSRKAKVHPEPEVNSDMNKNEDEPVEPQPPNSPRPEEENKDDAVANQLDQSQDAEITLPVPGSVTVLNSQ